jgi:predicted outer membrane repeat protein
MRGTRTRSAAIVTAGTLAGWTLLAAQPAAARAVDFVPCSVVALSSGLAAQASGEILRLAPHCTYDLTAALPDITRQDLAIRAGPGTVLEHSTTPRTPAFSLLTVDSGASLAVNGLTFTGGLATYGGAIDNNGSLTITRSAFTANSTTNKGGAIASGQNGTATLTVTGSTFAGNTSGNRGGAIASGNGNANYSTATITGSTFTGNYAANWGGGVYSEGRLTVNGSVFTGNNALATGGGGIATVSGSLTVHGGAFTGNTGGFGGGGILALSGSSVIEGARFTGNTALFGGGIYGGNLQVVDSTFTRNAAYRSGGAVESFATGAVTWSQFRGNSARDVGGAIYVPSGSASSLTVHSSLIAGNTAKAGGGGIYTAAGDSSVTLTGITDVTGNQPDNCEPAGTVTRCPNG